MHRQNGTSVNIDGWFKQVRETYANQMQCGKGCTACCYGLFDISLADAVEVACGFQKLTLPLQHEIDSEAEQLYQRVASASPDFSAPILFAEDDTRIDEIV